MFGRNAFVLTCFVLFMFTIKVSFLKIKLILRMFRSLGNKDYSIFGYMAIMFHFTVQIECGEMIRVIL